MIGLGLRLLSATAVAALAFALPASAQDKVKIGYAISKTGPNAGGASITQIPNYEMWVKDVMAKGGLKVGDKRLPIEVVEYDDRSNSEEAVRAVERLITQDKVDLLFPPWGTGLNLAVGPVFNKYGYPQLAFSAVTDRAPELAKRWPNSFWLLGTVQAVCRCPDRLAEEDAGRGQDRAQHRHDLDRRRLRHRPLASRAQGLHRRGLQARLRQELSRSARRTSRR